MLNCINIKCYMLFDRVLFALQDTVFNFAINLNLILADF